MPTIMNSFSVSTLEKFSTASNRCFTAALSVTKKKNQKNKYPSMGEELNYGTFNIMKHYTATGKNKVKLYFLK